ncbi:PREDICTED: translation initiation factor IF-2-like [Rhinopithecus bieti]|uniref:translation initiation factor IF-2-like n=1 Tax=Rhinopithecus bieti TaxID=61621 RepID=UPI00083C4F52|nr:PREDICTED: translation initiation factor IF-2-like [Rhinopithecus bieti]
MLLRPQRPLQVPAPAAVPSAVPSAGPAAPPAARPWPPDGREGSGSPRKFQVRKQGHTFPEEGHGPSAREPHWCERSSRLRAGKCRAGGEGSPGARARPRAVPGSPEGAVRGRRRGDPEKGRAERQREPAGPRGVLGRLRNLPACLFLRSFTGA